MPTVTLPTRWGPKLLDTLLPSSNRYVATIAFIDQSFGMGNLMIKRLIPTGGII